MLPARPIYLLADSTRVSQIVGNLLNNACKYTDPHGRIALTLEQEGTQAVMRVKDTGIGIASDQLPHLFEMFTQVTASLPRSQSGLGIGLGLVKQLVEMHRGTVEAHSSGIGQGSEFVVRLPLFDQPNRQQTENEVETGRPPPVQSGHRLLVVDDNRDAALSLAMLLRVRGHEVQVAHNGAAALEMASSYRPHMIFLDIGMPAMDGYEVARRIRRMTELKGVVLAALTGWGQEDDRRRTGDAGFDHHLVKPPEPRDLEELLASLDQRPS